MNRPPFWATLICALAIIASGIYAWDQNRESHDRIIAHQLADAAQERSDAAALVSAQVASCERVNALRDEFNVRGQGVNDWAHEEIALQEAVLGDPDATAVEKVSARLRIVQLSKLAETFGRIPVPDCATVVRGG